MLNYRFLGVGDDDDDDDDGGGDDDDGGGGDGEDDDDDDVVDDYEIEPSRETGEMEELVDWVAD